MIIEYRMTANYDGRPTSRVLRTYKDVKAVETAKGGVTYLQGIKPAEFDENLTVIEYARLFLIVAINLAPGEYLEVVDVPRD